MRSYEQARRLPDSAPRVRVFQQETITIGQETTVTTETATVATTIAQTLAQIWIRCTKLRSFPKRLLHFVVVFFQLKLLLHVILIVAFSNHF